MAVESKFITGFTLSQIGCLPAVRRATKRMGPPNLSGPDPVRLAAGKIHCFAPITTNLPRPRT
ncbi:hypothetical protein [Schlesneria paludicola]|uniref:hypothetical protein n=1 Tax=Schlesneria paludicola TaxID=360056 RepID=UPI00029A4A01|nr:hypothetical protein [Schlesneria paludicola]